MNKYKIISCYLVILIGVIMTSWIIWVRFLRERTIRDIPDPFFTEFRFWVILYICCIYFYVVKNLIKPKKSNEFLFWISELCFTPLITLDHFIKYNKFIKPYYYRLMFAVVDYFSNNIDGKKIIMAFILFQILPRTLLVTFLLWDTFYFLRLELLYKVILIGLLPFVFRYVIYSIKDVQKYWIKALDDKYDSVELFERGYEHILSRRQETEAKYHYKSLPISEYIEVKYENIMNNILDDDFPYTYVDYPLAKENIFIEYTRQTYNDHNTKLTKKDFDIIDADFHEIMPKILEFKYYIHLIEEKKDHFLIKWPKVDIFSTYLLCWTFILMINYYFYPVEFYLFHYFCENLVFYLLRMEDPFSMLDFYSRNKNYFTLDNLKRIFIAIINKIFK